MTEQSIGAINGKWSKAFRISMAVNLALVAPAIGWASWMTVSVLKLQHKLTINTMDRFSAAMFVEVQLELEERNPELVWLTAKEIRNIQRRNEPYLAH